MYDAPHSFDGARCATDARDPLGRDAFGRMLAAELPHLRRYAASLCRDRDDAEDLVQDCLVRAMRARSRFRAGTSARRWLFTILKNLERDRRRWKGRRGTDVPIEEAWPAPSRPAAQEHSLALREVAERLARLRPCDRRVFALAVFDGLSQEEIAARTGTAVGTVKSRLSRTRRALAEAG